MLYRIILAVVPESSRLVRPGKERMSQVRKRMNALGFHETRCERFSVSGVIDESELGVLGLPPGTLRLGVQYPTIPDPLLQALVSCVEAIPLPVHEVSASVSKKTRP